MAGKRSKSKKKLKPEEKAVKYLEQALDVCIQRINEEEPSDAVKLRWVHALSQTCAALSNMRKLLGKDETENELQDWLDRVLAEIPDEENRELTKKEALMAIKAFKNGNAKISGPYQKG